MPPREQRYVEWADVRGMRVFVAHKYFGVSTAVVWETVIRDIPRLRESVTRALDALEPR